MMITLKKLHRVYKETVLADMVAKITDVKRKVKYRVDFITQTTGLLCMLLIIPRYVKALY